MRRVHGRAPGTVVGPGEVIAVREGPEHAHRPGRVHAAAYLGERVLRPHRAAPDLRVIEEEQLIVRQVYARQRRLLTMARHPLFVRLYIFIVFISLLLVVYLFMK